MPRILRHALRCDRVRLFKRQLKGAIGGYNRSRRTQLASYPVPQTASFQGKPDRQLIRQKFNRAHQNLQGNHLRQERHQRNCRQKRQGRPDLRSFQEMSLPNRRHQPRKLRANQMPVEGVAKGGLQFIEDPVQKLNRQPEPLDLRVSSPADQKNPGSKPVEFQGRRRSKKPARLRGD